MIILNNYAKWKPFIKLNNEKVWDFIISKENGEPYNNYDSKKIISIFDFSKQFNNTIISEDEYYWNENKFQDFELKNIGFTGIDNGLISFKKDRTTNKEFLNILTNSTYKKNNRNIILHPVTGNTQNYTYPFTFRDDYVSLNGGFFQGFFKHDCVYDALPKSINDKWVLKFKIRPMDYEEKYNTLNSIYPNNKGIFFYMGLRSENKFLSEYGYDLSKFPKRGGVDEDLNDFCNNLTYYTESSEEKKEYYKDSYFTDFSNLECSDNNCPQKEYFQEGYLENDINIKDVEIEDSNGLNVNVKNYFEIKTDNKFLFFNKTEEGFNSKTWSDDDVILLTGITNTNKENLFLTMNKTKTGKTANDIIEEREKPNNEKLDISKDITNNAFALIIKDNGSIGYRYLVKNCDNENKYEIKEEYSFPNILQKDEWYDITIVLKQISNNNFKIFFYVNNKLKMVSKLLPSFNFRELDELPTRQETVPFNISIGGGTQGLIESMWLNMSQTYKYILPIEENFAGTFNGDIKMFTFYAF